ncbi:MULTISPECIES: transcriptional regulator BetI [Hyphomonas]|uniref:HTH-type transcriptional regulator BetI n=2 Tax=Hyphomonas adhaerens TaxID=81029 RepID=A0A069E009_9PROT|nr:MULTISPECIES: transcriptional regulator BetI [Hyphomonas]KCZ82791.1 TetR family transcriptional regulator [Hyphomonas adhaerens MHS-3]MBB40389.1 transcriptional regulator BetI [Hyphomonas sp.]HAE28652.1 transcriptional regulator BetI [Hyphomonas adhaerens]|tara:strand:- start:92 stop:697 length:606 start_codon:yes stop_codon:yes gene_type:complete
MKPVAQKRRQRDQSQRQLLEATIAAIYKHGVHDATVVKIGEIAGLSTGNIHYHFGSKEEMFAAAMRLLMSGISDELVLELSKADSPLERARAVLRANLSDELFTHRNCFVWLQFWSETARSEELARLERINSQRFHRNLLDALSRLMPREHAERATQELVALVDGLWIRRAQSEGRITPEAARQIADHYLDRRLKTAPSIG